MPELPEVETTKSSLAPLLGKTVSKVEIYQPKLRWPMPNDLTSLSGYQFTDVTRRAKYLILEFRHNNIELAESAAVKRLIIHLGMSGSLQQLPALSEKRKHDHLIINFTDNNLNDASNNDGLSTALHYHDPRRFGAVLWHEEYKDKLLRHLGIEPLDDGFDGDYLYRLIQRLDAADLGKKRPIMRAIKSVIMDQQVVVGVGNIYATESLHLAGIHPATPAHLLTVSQLEVLVSLIKTILAKSIVQGGSSLRDFTVANGQTGYFQQTLHAYGRQGEPCLQCGQILENIKVNGRASVFCPNCQTIES